jgi:hypothetical protein
MSLRSRKFIYQIPTAERVRKPDAAGEPVPGVQLRGQEGMEACYLTLLAAGIHRLQDQ